MKKYKKLAFEITGLEPGSLIELSNPLLPAKSVVPDWYRDTPRHKMTNAESVNTKKNIKYCNPFGDSFLTGYIVTTPCDVIIERDPINSTLKILTPLDETLFEPRSKDSKGLMPYPDGCYKKDFTYKHPLHMKLPKGYSAIITHPINRHDLPWVMLTGIVDADKEPLRPGNMPIFFKENFEGIVPKGTPLFQIIPFKRESWKSVRDPNLLKTFAKQMYEVQSVVQGWYRKVGWSKKDYS